MIDKNIIAKLECLQNNFNPHFYIMTEALF